ncbi:hypothetical protein B0H11DRAFT_1018071 [Mycena galericulata]|nr:hypothetical protein B0H11DRAFT_1018071 [Mycena galericulata]
MSSSNADLRARLVRVQAQIGEQEKRLEELKETRRSIQCHLDVIVYPVLTLPNEITSQIFLQCLPSQPDSNDHTRTLNPKIRGPDSSRAPLLLLHVCRAWRSIAISTPRLWVDLQLNLIDLPLDMYKETSNLMAFIQTWVDRAGACPLSLVFYNSSVDGEFPSSTLRTPILSYRHRIRCLTLRTEESHFSGLADAGPFPLLEKLTIGIPFLEEELVDVDSVDLDLMGIARSANSLRELTLVDGVSPSMCSFPWEQLTKFTCGSLTGDELLDLLQDAKSLLECTCSVFFGEDILHTDVLSHMRLQTLCLIDDSDTNVLQLLRLPVLQHLHLHDLTEELDDDVFLPFLSRTSSSLKTFVYSGQGMSVQWFTIMSGLTSVELTKPPWRVLRALFELLDRTAEKDFLPHLQELVILNCSQHVDLYLLKALSSRSTAQAGMAKLCSFRAIWPDGLWMSIHPPDLDVLHGLVASGMEIHVGSSNTNQV